MKENEIVTDQPEIEQGESVDEVTLLKEENQRLLEENQKLKSDIEFIKSQNEKAVYEREDWEDMISSFLISYPEALDRSKEIAEELIASKDLAFMPNALERAYICVLKRNKTPDMLIEDEEFLKNYVYPSKKVKDKIIADYVSEIEKGAPSVITKGGEVFLSPPIKPRNLRDCLKLAEKYLS